MAAPNQPNSNQISQVLDEMWTRYLPDIRDRISVLEAAAAASANNQLTAEQCEAAHAAAHKLAGTLGTFGLMRGTELARRFETEFANGPGPDPNQATALVGDAAEIRAMIENRKSAA